jgi:hypothetical protein
MKAAIPFISLILAGCGPIAITLSNVNPETRGDVMRIYPSVVSVDPPTKFANLNVSDLTVSIFEESLTGDLKHTKFIAELEKVYVNDSDFYWKIDISPSRWKARGYRINFDRSGIPLFGFSADFRYDLITPYDY